LLSSQRPQGVGGDLFIVPTTKRANGRLSTRQVRWTSLESGVKPLEADPRMNKSSRSDKSGATIGLALWSLADKALEFGLRPDKFGRPDKSGATTGQVWQGALESGPGLWNPMDSLDKSGET
jgi:hypothetical protein